MFPLSHPDSECLKFSREGKGAIMFLIYGWHDPHSLYVPFDLILYWPSCVVKCFRQTEVLLRPHIETILRQFSAQQPANRKPLLASNRARMLWEIIQLGATKSLPITELTLYWPWSKKLQHPIENWEHCNLFHREKAPFFGPFLLPWVMCSLTDSLTPAVMTWLMWPQPT